MKEFNCQIIKYAAVIAAIAELISILAIGIDVSFVIGLLIGTAVSIFGFLVLSYTGQKLVGEGNKFLIILGYIIKIGLYAFSFFFCIRYTLPCGFGCGCGFVTVPAGIMILYGVVYRFIKKKDNPLNDWVGPKEWNDLSIYDDDDDWK